MMEFTDGSKNEKCLGTCLSFENGSKNKFAGGFVIKDKYNSGDNYNNFSNNNKKKPNKQYNAYKSINEVQSRIGNVSIDFDGNILWYFKYDLYNIMV